MCLATRLSTQGWRSSNNEEHDVSVETWRGGKPPTSFPLIPPPPPPPPPRPTSLLPRPCYEYALTDTWCGRGVTRPREGKRRWALLDASQRRNDAEGHHLALNRGALMCGLKMGFLMSSWNVDAWFEFASWLLILRVLCFDELSMDCGFPAQVWILWILFCVFTFWRALEISTQIQASFS